MNFKKLYLDHWRQYKSIDINFHPNVTIITGPNGTGKSTILSIINRHFGYSRNYIATPKKKKGLQGVLYSNGIFKSLVDGIRKVGNIRQLKTLREDEIGYIEYSNNIITNIHIPNANSMQYNIQLRKQQNVEGFHIDSHSMPAIYRAVPQLNMKKVTKEIFHHQFIQEARHVYNSGQPNNGMLYWIKSALISMSIFGYGNPTMEGNPELIDIFNGFETKLKITLPDSLGFKRLRINEAEVILVTDTGNFVIDAASGGILKIIEITWQIYCYSLIENNFVVTMDEPENHLHPSMQRTILTDLQSAFPEIQFIVVSHSPFIVSSVENSNVYVLRNEKIENIEDETDTLADKSLQSGHRVVSYLLDTVNKAASATEILQDVLGVPTTIPDWAEQKTINIVRSYKSQAITENSLQTLINELELHGLTSQLPKALQELRSDDKT